MRLELFGERAHRGVLPPREKMGVDASNPLDAFLVRNRPGQQQGIHGPCTCLVDLAEMSEGHRQVG
jgi:hypothetical protein